MKKICEKGIFLFLVCALLVMTAGCSSNQEAERTEETSKTETDGYPMNFENYGREVTVEGRCV